ncbi:MAG: hypothetical protein ACJ8DQ_15915, partial [Xanthobacteraceae bacterium]
MSGIRSTIHDASALLPKFVIHRSILRHELRKQRGTSKSMILVPPFDESSYSSLRQAVEEFQIGGTG